jgi:competence protein ComEC
VLRIAAGSHVILLPGDIERAAEAWLLAGQPDKLRADLVVVPHHGSRTSSTEGFVAASSPRHALVAAGWRNRWGLPRPEVVERYRRAGAAVAVTGDCGALLTRVSTAHGVESLQRWREASRRFWNFGCAPRDDPARSATASREEGP